MSDRDEIEVEEMPEKVKPADPDKPKKKRKYKRAGSDQVHVRYMVPRPVWEELRRQAGKNKTTALRLLLECFFDILPEPRAEELRKLVPPFLVSRAKLERGELNTARHLTNRPNKVACPECRSAHDEMPSYGPWHLTTCSKWRQRGTIMVDGEKI